MASWTGVVTNAGKTLLASWVDGTTLNFDGAEAGTGTVSESALLAQTKLVNKKQDISILGGQRVSDGVKLTLQITAPDEGYTLNQIGITATSGASSAMLAILQNSDGVAIPSYSDTPDFVYKHFAVIEISNTGEFTLTVDTSALVSHSSLEEALKGKADLDSDGKVVTSQLPVMDYDPTGSADAVQANLNLHTGNQSNPHGVTAAQANAIPSGEKGAAGGVASLGSDGKVPDSQLPDLNYDPSGSADAVQSNLNTHISDKSNPHDVTAAQVGLGNVDNTSDADKPISTAQQTAITAAQNAANTAQTTANSAQTTASAALARSGGTMTGNLISNNPSVGTQAVRNIYAGTSDLTAGSSSLTTGLIYFVYE